jgi:ADP-ribosylglycohydrolase
MPFPPDHDLRLAQALVVLDGLSIGDAFGQQFFTPGVREWCFSNRSIPPGRWKYTDDTEMALGVVEVLERHARLDQDALAAVFARRYIRDPSRGYGAGAHRVLSAIAAGADWRNAARDIFDGQGSLGNGAAMRVAPLAAFFADDMDRVVREAAVSAAVTHAHPEGVAGAIAVAVATAWCINQRRGEGAPSGADLFATVLDHTPESATRRGIEQAAEMPLDEWEYTAANLLGNGSRITASDTVPFCLWAAARSLDNFTEALWTTVRVEGDMDTNAAIVGGIVAAAVGADDIPESWLRAREPLSRFSPNQNDE